MITTRDSSLISMMDTCQGGNDEPRLSGSRCGGEPRLSMRGGAKASRESLPAKPKRASVSIITVHPVIRRSSDGDLPACRSPLLHPAWAGAAQPGRASRSRTPGQCMLEFGTRKGFSARGQLMSKLLDDRYPYYQASSHPPLRSLSCTQATSTHALAELYHYPWPAPVHTAAVLELYPGTSSFRMEPLLSTTTTTCVVVPPSPPSNTGGPEPSPAWSSRQLVTSCLLVSSVMYTMPCDACLGIEGGLITGTEKPFAE